MNIGETKTISGVYVTRNSGSYLVSCMYRGERIKKIFVGYTQRESVQKFKEFRLSQMAVVNQVKSHR